MTQTDNTQTLINALARIEELEAENNKLECAMKIQSNAVKTMRSCEAQINEYRLRRAEQIMHECDPSNVESEKNMNSILTGQIEQLEAENARLTERAKIARREALEQVIVSLTGIIPFNMIASESDAPWAVDQCKKVIRALMEKET